jgi:fructose/tagatose bisphosphate aldolase
MTPPVGRRAEQCRAFYVGDWTLAIHGGTGFPPASVAAAISLGVAKFNVGTRLKRGFLDAVLDRTRSWSGNESVHDLVGSHKQADFLGAGQSAITETRPLPAAPLRLIGPGITRVPRSRRGLSS